MKLTTIHNLLSKLVRDYPLQEEPTLAMIQEWCREALSGVDAYDQWEEKRLEVVIKNYTTPIPADFYSFDHSKGSYQAREQGSNLYFSIKDGKFTLNYLAYPTDSDGFILLPDTIEYLETLTYYCVANLCRKRYITNDREFNYENYRAKYNDKKFEARADLYLRDIKARDNLADEYHNMQRGQGYLRIYDGLN